MNGIFSHQLELIRKGFKSVCDSPIYSILNASELEVAMAGKEEFDLSELEQFVSYEGYESSDSLIRMFWNVIRSFTKEEQRLFLQFVTASDRIPLNGLKGLGIVIQKNGGDSDRLPTALTCFSRLLLPEYSSEAKIKDKLTVAINNGQGFGLY